MTADRARVLASGGLDLGNGVLVSSRDVHVRVTTSGGPGGQHANRTLSRVIATLDVSHAESFSESERARLLEQLGPLVSASSSGSRSQAQNKLVALERLARRLADALYEDPPRQPTRPTRSSRVRRLDTKRRRGALKAQRQQRDDD